MAKKVRCKFVCENVTNYEHSKTAKLRAVSGNDGENKDFTQYTPSGNIDVSFTNDAAAAELFEPGKSFYVDFTEAENI